MNEEQAKALMHLHNEVVLAFIAVPVDAFRCGEVMEQHEAYIRFLTKDPT